MNNLTLKDNRLVGNPDPETQLENAANNVYEALLSSDGEDEADEDVLWLREQRIMHKSLHWLRRPSVFSVCFLLFTLTFSMMSGLATKQMITYKLACNYLSEKIGMETCDGKDTQSLVSDLQLWTATISGTFMLVASGKIAPLSDQYGRKPLICAVISIGFIGQLLLYYVLHHFTVLKFALLMTSDVITNIFGGIGAAVTLANCYIADVVEPHERIYWLGFGVASLFIGSSLGPLVGNAVLSLHKESSDQTKSSDVQPGTILSSEFTPLKLELVLLLFTVLYGIFILPESRGEKARRKSRTLSLSLLNTDSICLGEEGKLAKLWNYFNFLHPLKLLLPYNTNGKNMKETIIVWILVFNECVLVSMAMVMGNIYALYGIFKFKWTQVDIGQLMAVVCASRAIVLIILSPIINHKVLQGLLKLKVFRLHFDMIDFSMCFFAFICESLGFLFFSMSKSTITFYIILATLMSFGSLAGPAIGSSVIKFYPESKTGEVFGALAILRNFGSMISPALYLSLYKFCLNTLDKPEVFFAIVAAFMGFCALSIELGRRMLGLSPITEIHDLKSKSSSNFSESRVFN